MAAVLAFVEIGVGWQWATFIVVSTVAFVSLRRLSDRLTHEPPVKTGSDRLLGEIGVVIEDLTPNSLEGQVRVNREEWRADAPGHGMVPVGSRVVVEGISGTHLVVRPEVEEID